MAKIEIFQNPNIRVVLSFISSFLITVISLPTIYRVSKLKKLYDIPDERKVHKSAIPRLGGMGIFVGFTLSSLLFINVSEYPNIAAIIASVIVMFFVGLKDDILIIAPLTKMLGQIAAALIIIIFGQIFIDDLHGFFHIHHISYILGLLITLLTILVITNAFNLIDGIDGLAASLAIVSAISFGIWFWLTGFYELTIISASLIGALLGFLPFNFSKKQKMFMGDTGALIIGIVISVLAIEFNQKDLIIKDSPYYILPAPSVSFAILIVPLFDLLRVMYIRFLTKQKIFKADQNHIHHVFLRLKFTHKQIVLILVAINIFFVIIAFWLQKYFTIRRLLLLILLLAMIVFYIPASIDRRKNLRKE